MTAIILLILVVLVLVFFEVILPGGVLGVLAGIAWIGATYLAFSGYGAYVGMVVLFGTILLAVLQVFLQFTLLARTPLGRDFFNDASIDTPQRLPENSDNLVGKQGETLTRLNPTGMIRLDGCRYEAASTGAYIEAGESVEVTAQSPFRLTVKKSNP